MRHRRHPRTLARPAVILVVGLALGLLFAMQIVALIRDARTSGAFARRPVMPVEPQTEKPTEEDLALAHALAAAIHARTAEDCRALAPKHRQGCLSYVAQQEEDTFARPAAAR